jgi:hypothetical protein
MEHRWGERIQVKLPVRVMAHRFSVRDAWLADMSVSGALVKGNLDARLLSRIQVALALPPRPKHESLVVEAYVARKYKDGFGIEWCEFAPGAIRELLSAVTARPHTRFRRHSPSASITIARLSPPLLKHGA